MGVASLVAALWLSGAANPTALLDPGAAVRWGLPAVKVVGNVAGAVTLGALALAAFVLPRRPATARRKHAPAYDDVGPGVSDDVGPGPTHDDAGPPVETPGAWPTTMVVAAVAAGIWTLASIAHLVLGYASVAGRPLGGEGFSAELGLFVTSITYGRILVGVIAVAAVTCVVALLVTTPRGALLAGLLAVLALVLQAQTGHASGSTNHDLALSSMFLHLVAVALWIGGLVALAVVAGRLGPDLTAAVSRYSSLALWCFLGVGVSGMVNSFIRLSGTEGFAVERLWTAYGVQVLVKAGLLAVLGVFGWWHRRRVIPRLATAPNVFWRLVAVELAVMGAVSGVAVALSRTEPPVPLEPAGELTPAQIVTGHPLPPAPTTELWLTSFRWNLLVALGCLAGLVVYLRWVHRLRVRGDRWPISRSISLVVGLLIMAWTTSGGPAVYGHVLFSAHMIQHMILAMVVPIFFVMAAPITLAARALPPRRDGSRGPREWILGFVHSRWAGFFAHPVVAAAVFVGSMIAFYYTELFRLALTTHVGHLAMIVHFTVVGYLFVNVLIGVDPGPRRPAYPVRLLLLFATMAAHAFFGVALVSDTTLLVPEWFGLLGRPWGPPALEDQQAGGAIAWGVSEVPMLVLAIALAVAWTRDDERTARRRDRAADRDGDAELTAYNAMLSGLAKGEQRPRD